MLRMLFMATCILAQTAVAQLGVPAVRLPALPPLQVPQALNPALPGSADALNPRELRELRHVRIRALLRTHAAVIEADPAGAPIIRNEVLAFSPRDEALAAARAAGFTVARERALEGIDARIVVLQVPAGVSTARALERLRTLDPQGLYDFNHIYMDSGSSATATRPSANEDRPAKGDIGGARLKIGLIDGGVAVTHAVFRDLPVHQHGCADPVPSAHATAVASLMVGSSEQFHGSAPGVELYAADVYCGLPAGGAVDAVADAFSWLAREQVPVINVSLVGPPNLMLENVVRRVIAQGEIVVAAVGNDGPAAPPLYPAAYAGVVGVTAVDSRDRVLAEAARGSQVHFAAPGADMAAASEKEIFVIVRGTSFAAPIVAGLLAQPRALTKAAADEAIADLARHAVDLGAPGPDPVYGNGLVGASLRPAAALAKPRSSAVQN
jgi:subtilisin family serine protease